MIDRGMGDGRAGGAAKEPPEGAGATAVSSEPGARRTGLTGRSGTPVGRCCE